jgi:hypothetical protein
MVQCRQRLAEGLHQQRVVKENLDVNSGCACPRREDAAQDVAF